MRRNRTTSVDQTRKLLDNSPDPTGADHPTVADPRAAGSPGSGALARRIMAWSGNFLATCVIVILGLTFGKQVLYWWRGDLPVVSATANDLDSNLEGFADPNLPHLLEFGNLPLSFDRSVFEGDEDAALAQLRSKCRQLAVDFNARQQKTIPTSESLLRRLDACELVEQGEGWRIVQNGGPIITVVALRMASVTSPDGADGASQRAESVVTWGLGLRAPGSVTEDAVSSNRWTLFTCSGRSQAVDSDLNLSLPIPPASQRTVAVRVKNGGALIGFTGQGTATSSKQFFDQSFGERGWRRTRAWTPIGTTWHTRFQKPGSGMCDVQVLGTTNGDTSGILTISSAAQNSEK